LVRPRRVLPACLRAKYFSGPGDVAASHVWKPPAASVRGDPDTDPAALLRVAPLILPGSPVFAQSSLNPPEEKPPEKDRTSHQYVLLPHWPAKRFVESETHEKPNQGRAMTIPTTCAGLAGSSLGAGKEVK